MIGKEVVEGLREDFPPKPKSKIECMMCTSPAKWELRKIFPNRDSAEVLSCDRHLPEMVRAINSDGTTRFVVKEI